MLRFYHTNLENDGDITINDNSLLMDGKIWQNCRSFLQESDQKKDHVIELIPVKDAEGELIAYGYQDHEANRELRMLRELRENAQALQFADVFPEYQEVVIWGCNELAFFFAEYLKEQGIAATVIGQYWNCFGYEPCEQKIFSGKKATLVIYAEGMLLQNNSLYETTIRSVSPEFECIDRIYEANVLEGRIHDTIGGLDEFIAKLKEESEIVILGADMKAQDTYDLLMAHGIDICGFAMNNKRDELRLGRKIMSIEEAMQSLEHPVFLNYTDVHGALGEEWTEYFDYRGYERNKQYFLVRDYTDIPTSNLIHILHGKKVWLTGDPRLCQLLTDYLNLIENGEVTVQYTALGEKITAAEEDISCMVVPDYDNSKDRRENKVAERKEMLRKKLAEMGFIGHTEYFVCIRCFVLIDLYLNKDTEKYGVKELLPKRILLGRIPYHSGNIFFRGVMDGHPEILISHINSDFHNNMFYYCMRLANIDSDKVMPLFWEMYGAEASSDDLVILRHEIFEERVKSLLGIKERFTSQELFVLFSIAYIEVISSRHISDVSKLVIYWEPHTTDRNEFPFYALWLEDRKVNGNTILLCRDNMVRTGSMYNYIKKRNLSLSIQDAFDQLFLGDSIYDDGSVEYQSWAEHKMRFEDIKTKPMEKLTELCEIMDIEWSDSLLHTTQLGKPMIYPNPCGAKSGSIDFDLKPVFNKYEDYFSEFDRYRISIASSLYQKKYGYTYDNCLKFTRREVQEMFLKPFLFDEKAMFVESGYRVNIYEWIRWQLWNVRKHMVLDDVEAEFDRFELEHTGDKRMEEYRQKEKEKEIEKSIEYIRNHDKLILYGTGNNCRGLLKFVEESTKGRLLYSDKQAESGSFVFQGKNVIAPKALCSIYKDYNILVTSDLYRQNIENEFKDMGIDPSRVYYNGAGFPVTREETST